jgi:hypothetical protein
MFQGFNEIHDGNWTQAEKSNEYEIVNDWNQKFTDAVRGTGGNNEKRYLMYYGYMVSRKIAENGTLFAIPSDPIGGTGRQMVGFHFYIPTNFAIRTTTHLWPNNEYDSFNEGYAGTKAFIDEVFGKFKTKFTDNGIPVIIGENGPVKYVNWSGNTGYSSAYAAAARQNRLNLIDYFYSSARENELVPCFWEYGDNYNQANAGEGDFGLFNRSTGQPNSAESAEVIEHMIAAVNNTDPLPPGGGTPPTPGEGTAAVFSSWTTGKDDDGSSITYTETSGKHRIYGTIATVGEGDHYANIAATPNAATLAKMKTMTSFSFKVTGDGNQYDVMVSTSDTVSAGYNHYRKTFTATGTETTITVNVSQLAQADWGGAGNAPFTKNNIIEFQFQRVGKGTFDLSVSDITLY